MGVVQRLQGCTQTRFRAPLERAAVAVDPSRHQAFVAETFIRHSAAFDARQFFGKGDLFGTGARVVYCSGGQFGLCVDPSAEGAAILLHIPRQQGLIAQGQSAGIGDLARRGGDGKAGRIHDQMPF